MKYDKLKQKTEKELKDHLITLKKKLIRQKVAASTGGDTKVASEIGNTKKDIARVLTALNE